MTFFIAVTNGFLPLTNSASKPADVLPQSGRPKDGRSLPPLGADWQFGVADVCRLELVALVIADKFSGHSRAQETRRCTARHLAALS
jgi:hypothetical protein